MTGYICGTFLTACVVSRAVAGKSIAAVGNGNPGMANVMNHMGKKAGFTVLFGDILKTAVAMLISYLTFYENIGFIAVHYAGLGVVLGHDFPVFRKFKGGKGVSATCTWFILGFGGWGIFSCLMGAGTVFLTGWLPLAAVLITLSMLLLAFLRAGIEESFLVVIACALMFMRHFKGLKRIIRKEEPRHLKLIR